MRPTTGDLSYYASFFIHLREELIEIVRIHLITYDLAKVAFFADNREIFCTFVTKFQIIWHNRQTTKRLFSQWLVLAKLIRLTNRYLRIFIYRSIMGRR